jgi:hypothetical protein
LGGESEVLPAVDEAQDLRAFGAVVSGGRGSVRRNKIDIHQRGNRALQAAEKLARAVGPGFISDISAMESIEALAPEACFSRIFLEIRPFSAAGKALPFQCNEFFPSL